jgi:integrase
MATLVTNERSPYFYFKFRLGDKQISRRIDPPVEHSPAGGSAAERKVFASRNRHRAQALADKAEELARMASGGADAAKVRDFLAEVVEAVAGKSVRPESTRKIYEAWLERERKKNKNPDTLDNYESRIRRFCGWLGKRAEEPADTLTLEECQKFYDERAGQIAPGTLKKEHEVLQMAFSSAIKKGLLRFNPWGGIERVKQVRRKGHGARKAFTVEQVKKLLAAAEPEMRGLIYLQAYAGLRLGDASRLKWSGVDFEGAGGVGVISFVPEKDSFQREHHEPLHPALKTFLQALRKKVKGEYVFPTLSKRAISGNRGLSRMFKLVMRDAGISPEWQKEHGSEGKRVATLSNHSLRYFFLSQLREHGVSTENRMDIVGHENVTVHKGYSAVGMRVLGKELETVKAIPPPSLVS